MTLVKNALNHPYTPTVGGAIAPQGTADLTLTYPQEADAVAIGALIVLDPDYVPPDEPPPPLTGGWRSPVSVEADLPTAGNEHGDVRMVVSLDAPFMWDAVAGAWEQIAGGGGGGGSGNARVLLWDAEAGAYDHPEWWADTSVPREFRGPVDPSTVEGITLAFGDVWTPTAEPA